MVDNKLVLDIPIVDSQKESPQPRENEPTQTEGSALSRQEKEQNQQEQMLRKAKDEAYQAGLEKGIEEGIETGKKQAESSFDTRQVDALDALETEKGQLAESLTKLNDLVKELEQEKKKFETAVKDAAFSLSSKLITDLFISFLADKDSVKRSIDLMVAEHFGDLSVEVFVGKSILKQLPDNEHQFQTSLNTGDWEIELSRKGQTVLVDYKNYFTKLAELLK